ncbi:transposase, partial [Rossellomorea aquimaris]|nr:transposase [Rossellomorea aquimaris]
MTRKKAIKVLRKKKKTDNIQRFTQTQNLGGNSLAAKEFKTLKRMTHSAKALRNVGLHVIKKSFREHNKMPTTKQIDDAMKADVNYWGAQSNSVQAIRRSL